MDVHIHEKTYCKNLNWNSTHSHSGFIYKVRFITDVSSLPLYWNKWANQLMHLKAEGFEQLNTLNDSVEPFNAIHVPAKSTVIRKKLIQNLPSRILLHACSSQTNRKQECRTAEIIIIRSSNPSNFTSLMLVAVCVLNNYQTIYFFQALRHSWWLFLWSEAAGMYTVASITGV